MVSAVVYRRVVRHPSVIVCCLKPKEWFFFWDLFDCTQVSRFFKVGVCVSVCVFVHLYEYLFSPSSAFLDSYGSYSPWYTQNKAMSHTQTNKQTNLIPVINVSTLCFLV